MFKRSLPVIQTILDDHGTDLGVRTEGRKFVYYYAKLPQLQYVVFDLIQSLKKFFFFCRLSCFSKLDIKNN